MSRNGGRGVILTGGRWRGRRLAVPPGVRPTESRVREALFSIWQAELVGARFLDLFSGSGAVGLEAQSRGAASVTLVEGDRRVATRLVHNLEALDVGRPVRLLRASALEACRVLQRDTLFFDLVFADPPYRFTGYAGLLAAVAELLAPGGRMALEHSSHTALPPLPEGLEKEGERRYGDSCLTLLRRPKGQPSPSLTERRGD